MQEPPMNNSTERRQFWRADFHAPAHATVLGRDHAVRVLDVSLKGALIEQVDDWLARAGQVCHLRIALAPSIVITMEARVAHIDGKHIGLRCDKIDLDSITHLRQLVERNAEDPHVLDRDLVKLVARI
jgi:PilZ domain